MMTIGLPEFVFNSITVRAAIYNLPNSAYARRLLTEAINDLQFIERVERKIPTTLPQSGRPA